MNASRDLIRVAVAWAALGWCSVGGAGWALGAGAAAAVPVSVPFLLPSAAGAPAAVSASAADTTASGAAARTAGLVSDARAAQLAGMGMDDLFALAALPETMGDDYTAVREEILARPGAVEFVTEKAAPSTSTATTAAAAGTGATAWTTATAQAESVADVRARVLARAMLLWARDAQWYGVRTGYVVEGLVKAAKEEGALRSRVTTISGPLGGTDLLFSWGNPAEMVPAGPGSALTRPLAASAATTATARPRPRLMRTDDVPLLLEMALKGPTGDLRGQLESVPRADPLFLERAAIADAAGYRLWARAYAASRLWCTDDADALPILTDLMRSDPEPEVRACAATGLVNRGSAAIEPLLDALSDAEPVARFGATMTLTAITHQQFHGASGRETAAQYRAWWADHKDEFCANEAGGGKVEVHW